MKKSLLALAVLGAFAGAASAQTSVTMYGIVDMGYVHESGGADGSVNRLQSGGESSSRIGFRGTEDLGNGLSGIFAIEAGILADTGESQLGANIWGRQAFVGLKSKTAGTVTLGRQYTALHNEIVRLDPFGTGLAGNGANIIRDNSRFSNAIKYSTPNFAGFSAEADYSFGENTTGFGNTAGRGYDASVGYVNGPIGIKATYFNTRNNPTAATPTTQATNKITLLDGTYDFGVAKLSLGYEWAKADAFTATTTTNGVTTVRATGARDERNALVGVTVPFGATKLMASWGHRNDRNSNANDGNFYGIGLTYAVSKRTDFYTSFGRNTAGATINDAQNSYAANKLFDVGVRHLF